MIQTGRCRRPAGRPPQRGTAVGYRSSGNSALHTPHLTVALETAAEESQHGGPLRAQRARGLLHFLTGELRQRLEHCPVVVRFDHRRMDVALAADGGRVPQPLGHAFNRLDDVLLRLRV